MTREEIRNKAVNEQRALMESMDWRGGFISGAEWADKTIVKKSCKWLEDWDKKTMYELSMIMGSNFINDFKKAMEE